MQYPPANKVDINLSLQVLKKEILMKMILYVENINPAYVIGADKWEGD